MFTGITSHSSALVGAIVVLTGAATVGVGAAAADPNQDNQFLALLDKEGIPALANVPSLIATAHRDCHKLDSGMSLDDLVREKISDAYGVDPAERRYPTDRLARTMTLFITAAVDTYCPNDQNKIAASMAEPVPEPNVPVYRSAAYAHSTVTLESDLRQQMRRDAADAVAASLVGALPTGDLTPSNPPQIPPPPPAVKIQTPHRVVAAQPRPQQPPPPPKKQPSPPPQQSPPPPQQLPPPPQQPPPPPQQPPPPPPLQPPPVAAPQPGDAAGTGGAASNGGGGLGGGGGGGGFGEGGGIGGGGGGTGGVKAGGGAPAEPAPEPPMPPGYVRLAP